MSVCGPTFPSLKKIKDLKAHKIQCFGINLKLIQKGKEYPCYPFIANIWHIEIRKIK